MHWSYRLLNRSHGEGSMSSVNNFLRATSKSCFLLFFPFRNGRKCWIGLKWEFKSCWEGVFYKFQKRRFVSGIVKRPINCNHNKEGILQLKALRICQQFKCLIFWIYCIIEKYSTDFHNETPSGSPKYLQSSLHLSCF